MTYNNYLPPDGQLQDDSKLNGIYRVSFEIKVQSDDELSLSDVTQALTEGFERGFGDGFVNKVAELSVEKINKMGKESLKVLKVGDLVLIREDLKLKANIYSDDGYIFVGTANDISEIVEANVDLNIKAGSTGYINRIHKDGSLEVIDIDKPIIGYREAGIDSINVDLITVKAEQIEKIDSEEVK